MSDSANAEGLLHLGAFVLAVTGAYIGLDKMGHEKVKGAFERIAPAVAAEEAKNQDLFAALNLYRDEVATLHHFYGMFWQYLICIVTGIRYELPQRFRRCRSLWYFVRR
jgi:hypothetical protein